MSNGSATLHVPGLGEMSRDEQFGWLRSQPIPVPMFGGKPCRIVLEAYEEDDRKEDFHAAIANFLSGGPAVLRNTDEPLLRYYKDFEEFWLEEEREPIDPNELWQHVQLGAEPMLSRRSRGDKGVYVSVECECAWEPEHGLQLVLKDGLKITKLGGYDGHLTNADAFADASLEDVIYR